MRNTCKIFMGKISLLVGRLVGLKDWHKWPYDNDSVCCTQSGLRSVVGLVRLERRYQGDIKNLKEIWTSHCISEV